MADTDIPTPEEITRVERHKARLDHERQVIQAEKRNEQTQALLERMRERLMGHQVAAVWVELPDPFLPRCRCTCGECNCEDGPLIKVTLENSDTFSLVL